MDNEAISSICFSVVLCVFIVVLGWVITKRL